MSALLQRLKTLRTRTPLPSTAKKDERRGADRRALNAPAICIPAESRTSKIAFVAGVHWCHHLMEEPLLVAANREAKTKKCSHLYTSPRNSTVFGIVNIDAKDVAEHGSLIPLAVAFAMSVPDKNARAIYVLDMRESATEGYVFFAVVQRGNPIKEVLCPAAKYFDLLTSLAHDSSSPAAIFVDTTDDDTFEFIASAFASATQWPIAKLPTVGITPIHKVKAFNFTRTQLTLAVVALGIAAGYTYGVDYYQANLQAKSDEDLQRKIAEQYVVNRQQAFLATYAGTPDAAMDAYRATVAKTPLIRNGWLLKEIVCAVESGTCVYDWERIFGTNDSFVESAELPSLTFDQANYKTIKEARDFKLSTDQKPDWSALPEIGTFVRDNGDRSDTFNLAGIEEFTTSVMSDLVPWTGRGAPPGPVLTTAGWTIVAPVDQVQEAITNHRISPEFGVNKLTVTNRDGTIILKLEGNVYARKS